jgi:hypothetical protein
MFPNVHTDYGDVGEEGVLVGCCGDFEAFGGRVKALQLGGERMVRGNVQMERGGNPEWRIA